MRQLRVPRINPGLRDLRVPALLRDLPAFLIWRYEAQFEGDPKPRKVPCYSNGVRRHGQQGSGADRGNLVTFDKAKEAAIKRGFDGVGFALMPEWGVTALDFDNCVVNGKLPPEVEQVVARTYAEYSPSGNGVRAIVRGDLGNHKSTSGPEGSWGFETFASNGFVTLTGDMLPETELLGHEDLIAPADDTLVELCAKRFGRAGATQPSDDFMAGYEPRLGLTLDQMQGHLGKLDPGMSRDDWIKVGMALHHETEGGDEGFDLWNEWSESAHNYAGEEDLRKDWDSFERRAGPGRRQITFASVLKMANEATSSVYDGVVESSANGISATPYQWREPAEIPPRPWLVGRWILESTLAVAVAPGGIGKTTFLTALALSLATGRTFLGKAIHGGPAKIWIWNLEDDSDELSRSIQAAAKHFDVDPGDIAGFLFVDSGLDGQTLCTATEDGSGMKLLEPVFDALAAELKRRGIKVLIIDPFVSSHAVDENANVKIDKIAKAWARVAKESGCAVILTHHTSKVGSVEVNTQSARGASALTNAARTVLTLNRMTALEAKTLGVQEDERWRYIRVQDDKHNRAPAERADWFRLESVELGNGDLDRPGDSVGVITPWTLPATKDEITASQIGQIQEIAKASAYRKSEQATKGWFGDAIADVVGLDPKDQSQRRRLKLLIDDLIKRAYLAVEERSNERKNKSPYIVVGSNFAAAKAGEAAAADVAATPLPENPTGSGR